MFKMKDWAALTDSTKRQLQDAEKALHYDSAGSFEDIYIELFKEAKALDDPAFDIESSEAPILKTFVHQRENPSNLLHDLHDDVRLMDRALELVCTDSHFRKTVKAAPLITLASLGITLPVAAQEILQVADKNDPRLLINAVAAQSGSGNLVRLPAEQLAPGTGTAIIITILASGVLVAVVVVIRRRRRRREQQTPSDFQNPDSDSSDN